MSRGLIPTILLALVVPAVSLAQDVLPEPLPAAAEDPSEDDHDVLARGPVHEAFAEQVSPDPTMGITAPEPPPDPIKEVPPEEKPDGDDVVWIPGYWFWDDESLEYIWVSGLWRRVPPGRRWVPGYWQKADAGYRWVSGFWGSDAAGDIAYLDHPPESLEAGPSSPAPSAEHFWTPGVWLWEGREYQWQCGGWRRYREGWTWIAARYIWTPRGCIYVPGYWDFSLTRRGLLFAPICYRSSIYERVDYVYRPRCAVRYQPLLLHLFVRADCHHLFFGDYYSPRYRQLDYTPCHSYHARYPGYSSLYVYYEHHYRRRGLDYCGRVRNWHRYYADHAERRPGRTYRFQVRHAERLLDGTRWHHNELIQPYRLKTTGGGIGDSLGTVSRTVRHSQKRHVRELRELIHQRRQFELIDDDQHGRGRKADSRRAAQRGRLSLPPFPTAKSVPTATEVGGAKIPVAILRANRGDVTEKQTSADRKKVERPSGTEPHKTLSRAGNRQLFSRVFGRDSAASRSENRQVDAGHERDSDKRSMQKLLQPRRVHAPGQEKSADGGPPAASQRRGFRWPLASDSGRGASRGLKSEGKVSNKEKGLRVPQSRISRRNASSSDSAPNRQFAKIFSELARRGRRSTESNASQQDGSRAGKSRHPAAKSPAARLRSPSFTSRRPQSRGKAVRRRPGSRGSGE